MSHEVETMAWANEVPWHRLGREVGNDATPDQILRVADLDWNVQMKPVEWKINDAPRTYLVQAVQVCRSNSTDGCATDGQSLHKLDRWC